MDEHRVCCFGLRLWTNIIAWFQIVMNIIGCIMFTFAIIELALLSPVELKAKYFPDAIDGATSEYVYYMLMTCYQLILSGLGLTFGILLLKGANHGNMRYLRLWLAYAMLTMVYSVLAVGVQGFQSRYSKSSAEVLALIVSSAGILAFNGFSIYIVQDLIHIIRAERRGRLGGGEVCEEDVDVEAADEDEEPGCSHSSQKNRHRRVDEEQQPLIADD